MAIYEPVNPSTHGHLRWNRDQSLRFTAGMTSAPLTVSEFPKAALAMPIAFVESDGAYSPIAILGFERDKNLFFDPANGWQCHFTPVCLATYPFKIGKTGEQYVLCVDVESDQVSETDGEPFFLDNGKISPAIQAVAELLRTAERAHVTTRAVCDLLKQTGLIRPWTITIRTGNGDIKTSGLFQIDEAALNSVAADDLLELRRTGALTSAYCQLLSAQHLTTLGRPLPRAQVSVVQTQSADAPPAPDHDFFKRNETFGFDSLR